MKNLSKDKYLKYKLKYYLLKNKNIQKGGMDNDNNDNYESNNESEHETNIEDPEGYSTPQRNNSNHINPPPVRRPRLGENVDRDEYNEYHNNWDVDNEDDEYDYYDNNDNQNFDFPDLDELSNEKKYEVATDLIKKEKTINFTNININCNDFITFNDILILCDNKSEIKSIYQINTDGELLKTVQSYGDNLNFINPISIIKLNNQNIAILDNYKIIIFDNELNYLNTIEIEFNQINIEESDIKPFKIINNVFDSVIIIIFNNFPIINITYEGKYFFNYKSTDLTIKEFLNTIKETNQGTEQMYSILVGGTNLTWEEYLLEQPVINYTNNIIFNENSMIIFPEFINYMLFFTKLNNNLLKLKLPQESTKPITSFNLHFENFDDIIIEFINNDFIISINYENEYITIFDTDFNIYYEQKLEFTNFVNIKLLKNNKIGILDELGLLVIYDITELLNKLPLNISIKTFYDNLKLPNITGPSITIKYIINKENEKLFTYKLKFFDNNDNEINDKNVDIFTQLYSQQDDLFNSKLFFRYKNLITDKYDSAIDDSGLTKNTFFLISKYLIEDQNSILVKSFYDDEIFTLKSIEDFVNSEIEYDNKIVGELKEIDLNKEKLNNYLEKVEFFGKIFALAIINKINIPIKLDPFLLFYLKNDFITNDLIEKDKYIFNIINDYNKELLNNHPYACLKNFCNYKNNPKIKNSCAYDILDGVLEYNNLEDLKKIESINIKKIVDDNKIYNKIIFYNQFKIGFKKILDIDKYKFYRLSLKSINEIIYGIDDINRCILFKHMLSNDNINIIKEIISYYYDFYNNNPDDKFNGNEYLKLLLRAITSNSTIPINGYNNYPISIKFININKPISIHTCYNQFFINMDILCDYKKMNESNKNNSELYLLFSKNTLNNLVNDFSNV